MTRARSSLVSLSDTPWYHVVCRCVRRAFLCGEDRLTGQNFEHRRGWIVDRVKQLAGVFAIDVAAYAVMSNHYHLVLRVDAERASGWSREEVLRRWTQLFDGPKLVQTWLSDQADTLDAASLHAAGMMRCFGTAIGAPAHLTELCAQRQVKCLRGIQAARRAFEDKAA